MNLKLKNTPEQVELIKAMGSRDALVSREAQEAFAAFLGPVIMQVIEHAGTASAFYQDTTFDEDDSPSFPLDLYYNEGEGHVSVWSQSMAGGLPSSEVSGVKEMKIATYRLDSAVSFNKRYARRSRLEIISRAVERMAQEVLIKQERNAWAVVLKALADGKTLLDKNKSAGTYLDHLWHTGNGSTTVTAFNLDIFNQLMTRMRRIGESFAGGSPIGGDSFGVTDMYVSPETMEVLRSISYQHIGYGGDDETHSVSRTTNNVPDSVKQEIWSNAGMASIWGVTLHELIELGKGHKYTKLLDDMEATNVNDYDGANGVAFANATHDAAIAIDASKGAFIRALARNADSGSTFTALPDDQWNLNRLDKAGFYGSLEEGRVCIDARAIAGVMHV